MSKLTFTKCSTSKTIVSIYTFDNPDDYLPMLNLLPDLGNLVQVNIFSPSLNKDPEIYYKSNFRFIFIKNPNNIEASLILYKEKPYQTAIITPKSVIDLFGSELKDALVFEADENFNEFVDFYTTVIVLEHFCDVGRLAIFGFPILKTPVGILRSVSTIDTDAVKCISDAVEAIRSKINDAEFIGNVLKVMILVCCNPNTTQIKHIDEILQVTLPDKGSTSIFLSDMVYEYEQVLPISVHFIYSDCTDVSCDILMLTEQ